MSLAERDARVDPNGLDVAEAVRSADPASLLPARRSGEESRLALPLTLVAAAELPAVAPARVWATVLRDAAGAMLAVPLVTDRAAAGGVRRARAGDGAAEALLRLLAGAAPTESTQGSPGSFDVVALHALHDPNAPQAAGERALDVDQTHDSVVVGAGTASAVVVKWAVHVGAVPTSPPAVAAAQHLDAVGFGSMPAPIGFVVHRGPGAQVLLASVARFLPGAVDGWDWYVDALLDRVTAVTGVTGVTGRQDIAAAVQPAARIGELVAGLHAAFATAWTGCPVPVTTAGPGLAARWFSGALDTVAEAELVTTGPAADRFRRRVGTVRAVIRTGMSHASGTYMTRVHGDLHVGQVLRWDGGYALSDFDGNPVLPAAERVLPQPPARDVAGMLRAFDHVGRIVDRRTERAHAGQVRGWTAQVRQAFLTAYRDGLTGAGLSMLFDERLLPAFEVEQECRELVYSARHLPRWTYVPDAALTELVPVPGDEDESVDPRERRLDDGHQA